MTDLDFEIIWDTKNSCKKLNINTQTGCSSKELRAITECIRLESRDLDFGKYEASFDYKNMDLKITKAEVEA